MKIPKKKEKGLRAGQLIYNSIFEKFEDQILDSNFDTSVGEKLFYLENDKLQKLIDGYIKNH